MTIPELITQLMQARARAGEEVREAETALAAVLRKRAELDRAVVDAHRESRRIGEIRLMEHDSRTITIKVPALRHEEGNSEAPCGIPEELIGIIFQLTEQLYPEAANDDLVRGTTDQQLFCLLTDVYRLYAYTIDSDSGLLALHELVHNDPM